MSKSRWARGCHLPCGKITMPEKRNKAKARENEGLPASLYPVPHCQELVTLRNEFATSTILKITAPLYWTNLFPFSHVTWGGLFHACGYSFSGPISERPSGVGLPVHGGQRSTQVHDEATFAFDQRWCLETSVRPLVRRVHTPFRRGSIFVSSFRTALRGKWFALDLFVEQEEGCLPRCCHPPRPVSVCLC